MNTFSATLAKTNGENTHRGVAKWTPLLVRGLDTNGVSPEFLGFLYGPFKTGQRDRDITHIVTKMRGYSWYYNQYYGSQYSGVSVNIYTVFSIEEQEDKFLFQVDIPWSEEFQKPRKK